MWTYCYLSFCFVKFSHGLDPILIYILQAPHRSVEKKKCPKKRFSKVVFNLSLSVGTVGEVGGGTRHRRRRVRLPAGEERICQG
jgi:hypothetical protein